MNPEDITQKNSITLTPIKKNIKGRIDLTVLFRIQKDEESKEEKALIKFSGTMKVLKIDIIFFVWKQQFNKK